MCFKIPSTCRQKRVFFLSLSKRRKLFVSRLLSVCGEKEDFYPIRRRRKKDAKDKDEKERG